MDVSQRTAEDQKHMGSVNVMLYLKTDGRVDFSLKAWNDLEFLCTICSVTSTEVELGPFAWSLFPISFHGWMQSR